jgi:pSer/pThr/pTyr-binding forkhead associated (FHA) protein
MREPSDRPGDLLRRQRAERDGRPFLELRDGDGGQVIVVLDDATERAVVGRGSGCDVAVGWDDRVSRVHAELERVGGEWTVVDDGLSRNRTNVNGRRVTTRARLQDRDVLQVGHTHIVFRAPGGGGMVTVPGSAPVLEGEIPPAQRRVLVALCRPLLERPGDAALPATNEQIGGDLHLSVDAVKNHLRGLFRRFDIGELPQNEKRVRLARLAVQSGLVRPGDLDG